MMSPALGLAAAGLVSVTLVLLATDPGKAQSPERPTINIAATITAEPATQGPFPIRVGPAASIPRNSFVRVRGLPHMAALSEGHSIGPGSWAVSLGALPSLKITLPASSTGTADVVVTLVASDGSVLVEARTKLVISAPPAANVRAPDAPATASPVTIFGPGARQQPLAAKRVAGAGPAPQITVVPLSPKDRERALKLLKEGDQHMAQGNIAAARVVYELAAEAGLPQAAMGLAGTYDSAELARLNVRGIQADAKEARRWYERARQLGASDADQRLQRLGAN